MRRISDPVPSSHAAPMNPLIVSNSFMPFASPFATAPFWLSTPMVPNIPPACELLQQMFLSQIAPGIHPHQDIQQTDVQKQISLQMMLLMSGQGVNSNWNASQTLPSHLENLNTEERCEQVASSRQLEVPQECSSRRNESEEWPLDLSQKRVEATENDEETMECIDVVGTESDTSTPKDASTTESEEIASDDATPQNLAISKRTYSQIDLDAAVNDIRNGKLGTRRASVVYGIPRSTLRNKIYKLEAADELAGRPVLFKRRRPGGQKFDNSDSSKNSDYSVSPLIQCSSSSSRSGSETRSDSSSNSKKDPAGTSTESSSSCEDWTKTFWETFVAQQQQVFDQELCMLTPEKKNISEPIQLQVEHSAGEWKKSRPKRGQYRKYDKDALERAVHSVRIGEMSVHRAGSYYGVPHSTLEYKVKERNLLRTKQPRKKLELLALESHPDHSVC